MSEPDLDQELLRLLSATRVGTEPDANARARVRSALAVGLASAGASKVNLTAPAGVASKLRWLSALAVALLVGVGVLRWSAAPPPATTVSPASTPAPVDAVEQSFAPAPSPSAVPDAVVAPSAAAVAQRPAPLPPRVSASAPAKREQPGDELALASAMQLALRSGDAPHALALASEHERRFPAGALVQEREGARAIARCQLAEPAARAQIQSAFEARFAGSPYAARVRAACAR